MSWFAVICTFSIIILLLKCFGFQRLYFIIREFFTCHCLIKRIIKYRDPNYRQSMEKTDKILMEIINNDEDFVEVAVNYNQKDESPAM